MSGTDTPEEGTAGAGSPRRPIQICGRDRAVLRAVEAGRCQLWEGCEPLLVIDGLSCADSGVAHRLVVAGLLAPPTGMVAEARLTPAGRAALGLVTA